METQLWSSGTFNRPALSLQTKLVIGGILILLIPMIVIGAVTFIKSSRTLQDISSRQLVQAAEYLSGFIQITLEKDLRSLTTVASDPQVVHDVLAGDYGNVQKTLSALYPKTCAVCVHRFQSFFAPGIWS